MSLAIPSRPTAADQMVIDLDAFDLEALARAHDTPFYLYDFAAQRRCYPGVRLPIRRRG